MKNRSHATNHYRSKVAAYRYHELFGFSRAQVMQMLADGLIHVGQPPLCPGDTLITLEGGRYAIRPAYKIRPSVEEWIALTVERAA